MARRPGSLTRATLDTTSCADGPRSASLTYYWEDDYGSSHYWATSNGYTVGSVVRIDDISADRYFYPNTDGFEDSYQGWVTLSRPADVTVTAWSGGTKVATPVDSQPFGAEYGYFSWDGTDDVGDALPRGAYTLKVRAVDASGAEALATIRTGIGEDQPASLVAPAAGDTAVGYYDVVFAAAAGSPLDSLSSYSYGGWMSGAKGADGLWRARQYTTAWSSGDYPFTVYVSLTDPLGVAHQRSYNSTVHVDNAGLPLLVHVDPASGTAPFGAHLSFDSASGLTYTVRWDDDTTDTTGTTSGATTTVPTHTFGTPGVYDVSVTVSNGSKTTRRTTQVTVSAVPDAPPVVTLGMTDASGVAPFDTSATLSATDADGDAMTYALDFGDGSDTATSTGSLPHAAVPHTYQRAGVFTVRLSVSDGIRSTVATRQVTVGLAGPLTAHAGDDLVVVKGTPVSFDGSASEPRIGGIESYSWSFGDGTAGATGATTTHTWPTARALPYTVSLTVTSGTDTDTDTMDVLVVDPPAQPGLTVTVTDSDGTPVDGASLTVINADGQRFSDVSDAAGHASLPTLPDGRYSIYGWGAGFRPGVTQGTVTGGNGSTTLTLEAGEIAQTAMTATRMTRDEIIAAGIDPNDPDNQNVYEFEIHLAFFGTPITYAGYATEGGVVGGDFQGGSGGGGGGGGGGYGVGGYTVFPQVRYAGGEPQLLWLVIPGKARWLKEFFDVTLLVTSLAPPSFTLTDGSAALAELPAGLSLAPTGEPQQLVQDLPDISGGNTEQIDWIVRGDKEGLYSLSADVSAVLDPVGVPVALRAETPADALQVWGESAVVLTVDADDQAYTTNPYQLTVGIKNVADVPIYNPAVELLPPLDYSNYIYQPAETMEHAADELAPGESLSGTYYLIPTLTGTLSLADSFVKKTAGNVDPADVITSHPATPLPRPSLTVAPSGSDGVLDWAVVAGATSYEIFRTDTQRTPFGDDPVATTTGTHLVVPGGGTGWFAVSAIQPAGRRMWHPLVGRDAVVTTPTRLPAIRVHDAAVVEGGPDAQLTFDLELNRTSTTPVTVKVSTADKTATTGADYIAIPATTVTIPAGDTHKAVAVTVKGDAAFEGNEALTLKLSKAVGATIADTSAVGTIRDDEGSVFVSAPDVYAQEENPGAGGKLLFPVRLSQAPVAGQVVSVKTSVAAGTASSTDFTAPPPTTLTFAPGETMKYVTVPITGDVASEPNETVTLKLASPVGAKVSDTSALGTIVNDDGPQAVAPPGPSLSVTDAMTLEGDSGARDLMFTVALSREAASAVSVNVATANKSAVGSSDFTTRSSTVTFLPGETSKQFTVSISGDTTPEIDETFTVKLSKQSAGVVLADSAAVGYIASDDAQSLIWIEDTAAVEGDGAPTEIIWMVRLSTPLPEAMTFKYQITGGTATANVDYTPVTSAVKVEIPAGATTYAVTGRILSDEVREPDETVLAKISAAVGATLENTQATGTIIDDD